METYYITFRSVTFAQRAQALLQRQGFRPTLIRTPRWMEEQGCGYALKLRLRETGPVRRLLEENRLPLRKIYAQGETGEMEAVAP